MKVTKLTLGPLSSNCYIVSDSKEECIIIDPVWDPEYTSSVLNKQNLIPLAMFATHGHFDHIGAATGLSLIYDIPLYIHDKDKFLLERSRQTAIHFTKLDPGPIPYKVIYFEKEEYFGVSSFQVKLLSLPGHTPGSVGYIIDNMLFSGDCVIDQTEVGNTDHSYSNKKDMEISVKKVRSFEGIVYPGHKNPFKNNPEGV